MIDKKLFLQLREVANATCGNAYLMDSGKILTKREFQNLPKWDQLECCLFYRYTDRTIVKI